jgi:hypothetical protein
VEFGAAGLFYEPFDVKPSRRPHVAYSIVTYRPTQKI